MFTIVSYYIKYVMIYIYISFKDKLNLRGYKTLIEPRLRSNIDTDYSYKNRCEVIYNIYEIFGGIIFQKQSSAPIVK